MHGGQRKLKIAQNGQKCAHSWLAQMRHMPDSDRSVLGDWCQVMCVQHIFWASPNSSGFGYGRVAKWAHDLGWSQIANMAATVCQA